MADLCLDFDLWAMNPLLSAELYATDGDTVQLELYSTSDSTDADAIETVTLYPAGSLPGQAARQSPVAPRTAPSTTRRIRSVACSGSGWPASSQAAIASMTTVVVTCAAQSAQRSSETASST